jgi:hypothetical protein
MEDVVLLYASNGRLEGWESLDVGGPVELVIWRSVFSLETAPMWVSPTHPITQRLTKTTSGTIRRLLSGTGTVDDSRYNRYSRWLQGPQVQHV